MRRGLGLAIGMTVLAAVAGEARAQWGYPGGYGRYGWGGWGGTIANDPAAGYMAGLGQYARGQGAYEVQKAQADSINVDTMLKWNKALRERQRELRKEQLAADARKTARDRILERAEMIENGTSLNVLLDQILEFSAGSAKAYASQTPLSPAVIRDIPFESQSEAITVSLDQLTTAEAWPDELKADRLREKRQAVEAAADAAVAEDAKGDVSRKATERLNKAVAALRAEYVKSANNDTVEYAEADAYLKTLAGLSGLLHNPHFREIVAQLENYKGGDVGDLIAFMHAFNLRFGPAATDRQKEMYRRLYPMLLAVLNETGGSPENFKDNTDPTGKPLHNAARDAFKNMEWKNLDPQAK